MAPRIILSYKFDLKNSTAFLYFYGKYERKFWEISFKFYQIQRIAAKDDKKGSGFPASFCNSDRDAGVSCHWHRSCLGQGRTLSGPLLFRRNCVEFPRNPSGFPRDIASSGPKSVQSKGLNRTRPAAAGDARRKDAARRVAPGVPDYAEITVPVLPRMPSPARSSSVMRALRPGRDSAKPTAA